MLKFFKKFLRHASAGPFRVDLNPERGASLVGVLVAVGVGGALLYGALSGIRPMIKLAGDVDQRIKYEELRIEIRMKVNCTRTMANAPSPWTAGSAASIYNDANTAFISTPYSTLQKFQVRATTTATTGQFKLEVRKNTSDPWGELRHEVPLSCM